MAAPKGNQFWKLRSTHGREKLFATPDLLWEAATEYFNWVDAHPWYKVEANKTTGKLIKIPTVRPYTLRAFFLYVHASENFWSEFKKAKHQDFLGVIEQIENAMYSQKFEGAAVGAFNANIIARDLGLRDKTEITGEDGAPLIPAITHNVNFKKCDE